MDDRKNKGVAKQSSTPNKRSTKTEATLRTSKQKHTKEAPSSSKKESSTSIINDTATKVVDDLSERPEWDGEAYSKFLSRPMGEDDDPDYYKYLQRELGKYTPGHRYYDPTLTPPSASDDES